MNLFFSLGSAVIVSGSLTRDGDEENSVPKVFMNSIEKIDSKIFHLGKAIIIDVDHDVNNKTLEKIYDIINNAKGDKPVLLRLLNNKHRFTYKFSVEASSKIEEAIKNIIELEK